MAALSNYTYSDTQFDRWGWPFPRSGIYETHYNETRPSTSIGHWANYPVASQTIQVPVPPEPTRSQKNRRRPKQGFMNVPIMLRAPEQPPFDPPPPDPLPRAPSPLTTWASTLRNFLRFYGRY